MGATVWSTGTGEMTWWNQELRKVATSCLYFTAGMFEVNTQPQTRSAAYTALIEAKAEVRDRGWCSFFITGGQVRLLTATGLTLSMLCGILSLWAIAAELLAFRFEELISGSRCCGGSSCYTVAGIVSPNNTAEYYIDTKSVYNAILSEDVFNDAAYSTGLTFGGTCVVYGTATTLIKWILTACGFLTGLFCVRNLVQTYRAFSKSVRQVQSGLGRHYNLSVASDATALQGTMQHVGTLKYVGAQTTFALLGWAINTFFLVLLVFLVCFLFVLPSYGLAPNLKGAMFRALIWDEGPQWLVVLVFNYLALYFFVWCIDDSNQGLLSFFSMFQQFFYTLNAIGTLSMRLFYSMGMTLAYITRLDVQVVPGIYWLDPVMPSPAHAML